jgi:hypothetical protein
MRRLCVIAILVAVSTLGAAQALAVAEFHVDMGASWSAAPAAPGYVQLLDPNVNRWDGGTQVDLGNGVAVAWDHGMTNAWDYRDRGGSNPLLRDFASFQNAAITDPLSVKGLAAGSYDLTLYATDIWYGGLTVFEIDGNHDGVTDQTVTIDANVTSQMTVPVTVSTDGILWIGPRTPTRGCINGLDLVATPEPATLALLLGGMVVGAIRRRVRA